MNYLLYYTKNHNTQNEDKQNKNHNTQNEDKQNKNHNTQNEDKQNKNHNTENKKEEQHWSLQNTSDTCSAREWLDVNFSSTRPVKSIVSDRGNNIST